ncbi:prophage endopeptidase tail family protein [Salipaludibacillus sp. CF4.18]|uniref:prophage endopeptidase tail family protein n=1 Tax=Salipaludibacillus sp. CF4.18 TaxID=3373081 RepID=UPI003EE7F04F
MLTNIKGFTLNRKANGEKSVSFLCVPDETNEHSYPLLDGESSIEFYNARYVIKQVDKKNVGHKSIKSSFAIHDFFDNMRNIFEYDQWSGSQTFIVALERVFRNTPYSFQIVDTFLAESFENFGRDNKLSLFKDVLERYGAEFEVNGNIVTLKHKIGSHTGFLYRWGYNIKSIDYDVNTNDLATVIKGYGGKPDDDGNYPIEVTYESPNINLYPNVMHAPAVYNENLSTEEGMLKHLKKVLIDEPQVSVTVDIADLKEEIVNEGDTGYIIYEPFDNLQLEARVVELNEKFEYRNGEWVVVETQVKISNIKEDIKDVLTRFSNTSKQVNRVMSGQEKLPFSAMQDAIKVATDIIVNDNANFIRTDSYTMGVNVENPNYLTRQTSQGFGVSSDGGQTFPNAITHQGVVTNMLTAGTIKTQLIRIEGEENLFYWDGAELIAIDPNDLEKYTSLKSDGLVTMGTLTAYRDDGFPVMIGGKLQYDMNLQSANPPFRSKILTAQSEGEMITTDRTEFLNFDFYWIRHIARYLNFRVFQDTEGPAGSRSIVAISSTETGGTIVERETYGDDGFGGGHLITVDLGVPDGSYKSFYVRLRRNSTATSASLRIVNAYLEG